jgi:CubicO group peptidase (beta-lactamase class C family)
MSEVTQIQGTVLVVRGDKVLYEASGGFADVANGVACTPATRFQLASVSKQFTAAATLLQVEAGRVRLDSPVTEWFSDCPPSWSGITVHHLLTHTAGLNHWNDHPELDLCGWTPPSEAIKAFQAAPVRFSPGTDWYYSSPGYVLLAHIVERASGRPYRSYLQEAIFEPLGLSDTLVGMPDGQDRLAIPYAAGEPTPSFELDSLGMGAGDAWSTTHDLVRWDRALAAGSFLSNRSRELTFTPHAKIGVDRLADAYGYGWQLGTIAGHAVRFHSGGNAGFRTYNAWFPEIDGYVVVLSNQDEFDSQELTVKLAEAWL